MSRQIRVMRLWAICLAGPMLLMGASDEGQDLFVQRCAVCHTIGRGRLVGPDLAGVQGRRRADWLRAFVRSSQAMVRAGDPHAVAVFAQFQILMPDQPDLDDRQIDAIFAFIARETSDPAGPAAASTVQDAVPPDSASVARGANLFQGIERLVSGGPACNSCHNVVNDAVIGGGVLARELTDVFSRLGRAGVQSIVGSPPFPVMQQAYVGRVPTDDEVAALVAFLQDADARHLLQKPRDYGLNLFYSGVVGLALLYGFFGFAWSSRRRGSVYQAVYDRQVRSQ